MRCKMDTEYCNRYPMNVFFQGRGKIAKMLSGQISNLKSYSHSIVAGGFDEIS
jgi:hypothetical protein